MTEYLEDLESLIFIEKGTGISTSDEANKGRGGVDNRPLSSLPAGRFAKNSEVLAHSFRLKSRIAAINIICVSALYCIIEYGAVWYHKHGLVKI
jgi:hypothetical protein